MSDLRRSIREALTNLLESYCEPHNTLIDVLKSVGDADTIDASIKPTQSSDIVAIAHIPLKNFKIREGTKAVTKGEHFLIPVSIVDTIKAHVQLCDHISEFDKGYSTMIKASKLFTQASQLYKTIAEDDPARERLESLLSQLSKVRTRIAKVDNIKAVRRNRQRLVAERQRLARAVITGLGLRSDLSLSSDAEVRNLPFVASDTSGKEIDSLERSMNRLVKDLQEARDTNKRVRERVKNAEIFELDQKLKKLRANQASLDDRINRARAPTTAFEIPEVPSNLQEEREFLARSIKDNEDKIKAVKAENNDPDNHDAKRSLISNAEHDPREFLGRRGST